ncbi:FxDxF family PEP-CTERM protein [Aquabacterium sp.]|uniref:FxDxF family PEP-CTERM protein n=1 Tax=Aquabacterium sp. TaxID=1872578 RepID=UPI0019A9FA85|nr:FxDxF family PEP-CTERM protein [Aquabacterium sp.]MBC7702045.1 FxDxF family PEP-CTERM protein [Aquabacterium sp.]
MKLKMLAAAAIMWLSASASFAQDDPPTIPLVLSPSGPSTLTTSFERAVNGMFVDTFTFTPSAFNGEVFVNLRSIQGPTHLFSAILNGEGFSFDLEEGKQPFQFRSMVSADKLLHLTVLGFSGDLSTLTAVPGMYGGTITAQMTAVPEPQAYALALAGLAIAGVMARRSRRI